MKFNKTNPLHILIYIYGSFIFYFVYLISKVFAFPTENNIVLYGHKYYGNLKSLYENLDIKDGMEVSINYEIFFNNELTSKEKDIFFQDALKYCKLDTYAMIDLLKVLKNKI